MVVTTHTLDIGTIQALNVFDDVTHMAFGDDNTAPVASATALNNELFRINVTNITKNTVTNTYSFTGTIPISQFNSNTVYEIALFNAATSGDMAINIVLATGLTKTNDDELVFTLNIQTNTINN